MALDPQAVLFLEKLHRLGLPPIWEQGLEAVRMAQWQEAATAAFTPDDRFVSISDVTISREMELISEQPVDGVVDANPLVTNHTCLSLRWYEPENSTGDICLYFHGGGWAIGSVIAVDSLVRKLVLASGMTFVSVAYRLAPEHPFPAATLDAELALRWAYSRLPNGKKLAVAGDSAGANLAAVVCLMARDSHAPLPAAQVLFYPVTDCNFQTASYLKNREGHFLSQMDMQWFWSQYAEDADERQNPYLSPLQGNLNGLPPARICVAGHDPLHDDGEAYARKLVAAGCQVEFEDYPGMIHGFVKRFTDFAAGEIEIQKAANFLKRTLA